MPDFRAYPRINPTMPPVYLLRLAPYIFAAGLIYFFIPLYLNWNQPLVGMHGFRQTYTAISVQYMLKGGPWLIYETPILGAPWKVPLEFPLYHWCVILAHALLPVTLDQAGRLLNWSFFLLALWPLRIIVLRLGGDNTLFYIFGALLLFSPEYAFWSQAFLIESLALFLSISFVACLLLFLEKPTLPVIILLFITAIFASLVKITTFAAFAVAGALLILKDGWIHYRHNQWRRRILYYIVPASAVGVSLILLIIWLHAINTAENQSIININQTNEAGHQWNFGTWAQFFSRKFWNRVNLHMSLEILGMPGIIWLSGFIGLWALILSRHIAYGAAAISFTTLGLFLLPMAIFTNLHYMHNYYQVENAIFLIAAVAVLLRQVPNVLSPFMVCYALLLPISTEAFYGVNWYSNRLLADKTKEWDYQIARFIDSHTEKNTLMMGVGLDWSPEIPYYADRRAILIPEWITRNSLQTLIASPEKATDGIPITSFVDCSGAGQPRSPELAVPLKLLQQKFTAGMQRQVISHCDVYFR